MKVGFWKQLLAAFAATATVVLAMFVLTSLRPAHAEKGDVLDGYASWYGDLTDPTVAYTTTLEGDDVTVGSDDATHVIWNDGNGYTYTILVNKMDVGFQSGEVLTVTLDMGDSYECVADADYYIDPDGNDASAGDANSEDVFLCQDDRMYVGEVDTTSPYPEELDFANMVVTRTGIHSFTTRLWQTSGAGGPNVAVAAEGSTTNATSETTYLLVAPWVGIDEPTETIYVGQYITMTATVTPTMDESQASYYDPYSLWSMDEAEALKANFYSDADMVSTETVSGTDEVYSSLYYRNSGMVTHTVELTSAKTMFDGLMLNSASITDVEVMMPGLTLTADQTECEAAGCDVVLTATSDDHVYVSDMFTSTVEFAMEGVATTTDEDLPGGDTSVTTTVTLPANTGMVSMTYMVTATLNTLDDTSVDTITLTVLPSAMPAGVTVSADSPVTIQEGQVATTTVTAQLVDSKGNDWTPPEGSTYQVDLSATKGWFMGTGQSTTVDATVDANGTATAVLESGLPLSADVVASIVDATDATSDTATVVFEQAANARDSWVEVTYTAGVTGTESLTLTNAAGETLLNATIPTDMLPGQNDGATFYVRIFWLDAMQTANGYTVGNTTVPSPTLAVGGFVVEVYNANGTPVAAFDPGGTLFANPIVVNYTVSGSATTPPLMITSAYTGLFVGGEWVKQPSQVAIGAASASLAQVGATGTVTSQIYNTSTTGGPYAMLGADSMSVYLSLILR